MSQDDQDPLPEQETSQYVKIPSEVLEQLQKHNVTDIALKPRHIDIKNAFKDLIRDIYDLGRQSLSEVIGANSGNPVIADVMSELGRAVVLKSIVNKDQPSYPSIEGLLRQSKKQLLNFNGIRLKALEISTSPLDYGVLNRIFEPKDNIVRLPFNAMVRTSIELRKMGTVNWINLELLSYVTASYLDITLTKPNYVLLKNQMDSSNFQKIRPSVRTTAIDISEFSELYRQIQEKNAKASKTAIQLEIFAQKNLFRGGSASGEG